MGVSWPLDLLQREGPTMSYPNRKRAEPGPQREPGAASLTISELAARTGVGVEAIRYYERVGVFPRPPRISAGVGHAGYRRYTAADVERARFVRRARDLGFSLDEVRELMTLAASDPARSCGDVDAVARAHLAQVEAKLTQLMALRDELRQVIDACEGGLGIAECRILGALSSAGEWVESTCARGRDGAAVRSEEPAP